MEIINYDASKCVVQGLGASFLRDIKIRNFSDFKKLNEHLIMPERVSIIQPVFHPNKFEVIILERVKAGISYYVSIKIKNDIENASCTGVEFEIIEVV